MSRFQCEVCGMKDALIFRCSYCGHHFCAEHRLPEQHNCENKPKTSPWFASPPELSEPLPEMKDSNQKRYVNKGFVKKIAKIVISVIVIGFLLLFACSVFQGLYATPPKTLVSNEPYVEVVYTTIGWFYDDTIQKGEFGYTYLVLNVTISNHGYSQVNTIGGLGFSVIIDGKEGGSGFPDYTRLKNATSEYYISDLGSPLPSPAKLLDGGKISGLLAFKLGDPNLYPQPAPILNKPFVLKYKIPYGENPSFDEFLFGPFAEVKIVDGS